MKKKAKRTKVAEPEMAVSRVRQTSILRDMRVFYRTTNWAEWWDTWYAATNKDGGPKYKNLRDLVKVIASNDAQRVFTAWFLGPQQDDGEASPYKWCSPGPQDWSKRRREGGWFTDASIKGLGREICRRMTALEALREAGNGVTLNSLVRAEQLAQELDRSFNGRMFLTDLTFDQNMRRAREYVALHKEILSMKAQAQDLYAKSHGVNFEDMSGLTVLLQAASQSGGNIDAGNNRNQAALSAVVEMALAKSKMYDLELPAGAVEVMSDAAVKSDRKKGVQ